MAVGRTAEFLMKAVMFNIRQIDNREVARFVADTMKSRRIFVVGAGRSGYVARSFAMRLMHLGFEVFVVGETITPAIKKGDLLIAVSGSGETNSVALIAEAAKRQKARIVAITSHPASRIGKLADFIVRIGGRAEREREPDYAARQLAGGHEPLAPLGTLFELSTMFFLDAIISELMMRMRAKEGSLKEMHANLE